METLQALQAHEANISGQSATLVRKTGGKHFKHTLWPERLTCVPSAVPPLGSHKQIGQEWGSGSQLREEFLLPRCCLAPCHRHSIPVQCGGHLLRALDVFFLQAGVVLGSGLWAAPAADGGRSPSSSQFSAATSLSEVG